MDITGYFKAASVSPRRYGGKFTNLKFRPRIKSNRRYKTRKPKWMNNPLK